MMPRSAGPGTTMTMIPLDLQRSLVQYLLKVTPPSPIKAPPATHLQAFTDPLWTGVRVCRSIGRRADRSRSLGTLRCQAESKSTCSSCSLHSKQVSLPCSAA